jgi:hypothetical protein
VISHVAKDFNPLLIAEVKQFWILDFGATALLGVPRVVARGVILD